MQAQGIRTPRISTAVKRKARIKLEIVQEAPGCPCCSSNVREEGKLVHNVFCPTVAFKA
jgi:hypothetical protein